MKQNEICSEKYQYILLQTICKDNNNIKFKLAKVNQQYAAIKFIDDLKSYEEELKYLNVIKHPNITNLIDYYCNQTQQFLVFEYPQGGDLFTYLAESPFTEDVCRFYAKQLIDAIDYLHSQNIAHKNIKLETILLDQNFNLKLSFYPQSTSYNLPTNYIQPEPSDDLKTQDIFTFGVILFTMYSGIIPFNKASKLDFYYKPFLSNKPQVFWKIQSKLKIENFYSKQFIELINGIFEPNPQKRLTSHSIKQSAWINNEKIRIISEVQYVFHLKNSIIKAKQEQQKLERELHEFNKSNINCNSPNHSIHYQQYDFREVDKIYKLNENQRKIKYIPKCINEREYISAQDQEFLLRLLLLRQRDFCTQISEVSQKDYKLLCIVLSDDEDLLEFQIKLRITDFNLVKIQFNLKQGNFWQFQQIQLQIYNLIVNSEFS